MVATQYTTFQVNGKPISEIFNLPVTLETDGLRHLESGVINLYPNIKYQTIEGFGGAITESTGFLLKKMPPENSEALLRECFGENGNRYKFIRMNLDSCDYSLAEYQAVADPIADPGLVTFSIERDKQYGIPFVKKAITIAKEPLGILLSPWSPPSQWKTPPEKPKNDASVYGGLAAGRLPKVDYDTPQRCNGGRLKPEFYPSWANYLVKYVQAYLGEGLPVTMLSIQNESIAATMWDSCVWSPEEQKSFLRDYLYPAFKASGLTGKVGIYIWDHNKERVLEYSRQIIDEITDPMVSGIAFHWYSGDHFEAVEMTARKFPDKIMMSSECCHLHPPGLTSMFAPLIGDTTRPETVDYHDAVAYAHDIIGNLNAGMNRWIDWCIVNDENGGPRHVQGGFTSPMTAQEDGTYKKTITFDYIGHFSKYILPGAVRIGHSKCDDKCEITAAQNPDGSLVAVLLNKSVKDLAYVFRYDGEIIRFALPAETISTVIIPAK
jgi:glucosylceramidase